MHIHAIAADEVMQKLSVMSKLNADWEFLTHLRDDGREFAGRWLAEQLRPDRRRVDRSTCTTAISEPRASPLRRPAPRPIPARCR